MNFLEAIDQLDIDLERLHLPLLSNAELAFLNNQYGQQTDLATGFLLVALINHRQNRDGQTQGGTNPLPTRKPIIGWGK